MAPQAVYACGSSCTGVIGSPLPGDARAFGFGRVTDNSIADVGSQLGVVVKEVGGGATFTFHNSVGVKSSITDIYFDDMLPKLFKDVVYHSDSGIGVSFDSYASPGNLPGGSTIGFSADYSGDSDSRSRESGVVTKGTLENGVNKANEWVSFLGCWASTPSFDRLIASLGSGDFRVGLHIQGIGGDGKSDSYVNQLAAVPLPAAAWLFGSALLGFVAVSNRRRV